METIKTLTDQSFSLVRFQAELMMIRAAFRTEQLEVFPARAKVKSSFLVLLRTRFLDTFYYKINSFENALIPPSPVLIETQTQHHRRAKSTPSS